jgi:dTDP-4-amino-4,6-dideoxygalactose transaminase
MAAPTLAAMGDLRAAVCRHELLRQPPICRERRRRSDRLTERLRSWTGGHVAPGILHNHAQPLQLPLMVSDPARARHLTGLARAQGIIIGPSPWGRPLHHYPELAGKVRLATPSLPASEQAMQRLVLVPLHAGVTDEVLERIAALIQTVS